jgi:uncharacterized protein
MNTTHASSTSSGRSECQAARPSRDDNHVVAETITLTRRIGHEHASRLGDRLYGEKLASIHWTTPDEERAAFEYCKRHKDQAHSLVDCLSFVVMEKLGIREALAVDSDFTHRFVARPGPKRS